MPTQHPYAIPLLSLAVPWAGTRTLSLDLVARHRAEVAHPGIMLSFDFPTPVRHEIDLRVPLTELDRAHLAGAQPPDLADLGDPEDLVSEDGVLVARCSAFQFPVSYHREMRWPWFHWLSRADACDLSWAGMLASYAEAVRAEGSPTLTAGSLFYLAKVGVHPMARGQRLGERLLWRVIDGLSRHPGDLVVATAKPSHSAFETADDVGEPTEEEIVALAAYYARIGFRVVPHDEVTRVVARAHPQFRFPPWDPTGESRLLMVPPEGRSWLQGKRSKPCGCGSGKRLAICHGLLTGRVV